MFYIVAALGVTNFDAGRYRRRPALARRSTEDFAAYMPARRLLASSLAQSGAHKADHLAAHELHSRITSGYIVTAAIDHYALHDADLRQR